jgi:hypothetical protein
MRSVLPAPSFLSDHPVDKGQRTEAIVLAALVNMGLQVLLPYGVNHRYDLVVEHEDRHRPGRGRRPPRVFVAGDSTGQQPAATDTLGEGL